MDQVPRVKTQKGCRWMMDQRRQTEGNQKSRELSHATQVTARKRHTETMITVQLIVKIITFLEPVTVCCLRDRNCFITVQERPLSL